jgi:hypothetical protein
MRYKMKRKYSAGRFSHLAPAGWTSKQRFSEVSNNRSPRLVLYILVSLLLFSTAAAAQDQLDDEWVRFPLGGSSFGPLYSASSVLEPTEGIYRSRYGCEKAVDQDRATAWVEGVPGSGEGESYWLGLEHYPEALGFINGYAKNRNLFEKNYRVKSLNVQVYAAVNVSGFATEWEAFYDAQAITKKQILELADSMEPQHVPLPFDRRALISRMDEFQNSEVVRTLDIPQAKEMGMSGSENVPKGFRYIIRLEISATYPGTTWEDTCIAELWPDYGQVTVALLSGDSQRLNVVDSSGLRIPVYHDFDHILTLIETSRDKTWALVSKEPANPADGRVSTQYGIIHLPTGRELTSKILGLESEKLLPTNFSYEGGRSYVELENLESGEVDRKLCVLY